MTTRLTGGAVVEIRTATGTPDTWTAVTCEVMSASVAWGAGENAGVLTQGEPGGIELDLYDPDRLLDPLNLLSPYAGLVEPGLWIRLSHNDGTNTLIGQGVVDAIEHDLAASRGRIRANDWASWMANSPFPGRLYGLALEGFLTLQTLAEAMFAHVQSKAAAAGFAGTVIPTTVHAETASVPVFGVSYGSGGSNSGPPIWDHFTNAGRAYLYMVYLSRDNVLRAVDAMAPHGPRIELGLSGSQVLDLLTRADAANVINEVSVKGMQTTVNAVRSNAHSILRWGQKSEANERPVPTGRFGTVAVNVAIAYGDAVLADRAEPNPEAVPLDIWPQTGAELRALLAITPMQQVHMAFDNPALTAYARAIGQVVSVTPEGWTVSLVTYVNPADTPLALEAGVEEEPAAEPAPRRFDATLVLR